MERLAWLEFDHHATRLAGSVLVVHAAIFASGTAGSLRGGDRRLFSFHPIYSIRVRLLFWTRRWVLTIFCSNAKPSFARFTGSCL